LPGSLDPGREFLVEHPNAANRRYGQSFWSICGTIRIIHQRDSYARTASFRRALATVRNALVGDAVLQLPNTREAGNLADARRAYGQLLSLHHDTGCGTHQQLGGEAIRFVAIHRRLTQGRTASRTTLVRTHLDDRATCSQQGHSVFAFLCQAVVAHFHKRQPRHSQVSEVKPSAVQATSLA